MFFLRLFHQICDFLRYLAPDELTASQTLKRKLERFLNRIPRGVVIELINKRKSILDVEPISLLP
jgi:hypothetical protein